MAFRRDFTTIFAPESRAFSGTLKIEKLKAPLIPGPEGSVDTNDWRIKIFHSCKNDNFQMKICDVFLFVFLLKTLIVGTR